MIHFDIVPIEDLKRYAYERMRVSFCLLPFYTRYSGAKTREQIIQQYYKDRGWHAG